MKKRRVSLPKSSNEQPPAEKQQSATKNSVPLSKVQSHVYALGLFQRTANLITYNGCFGGAEHQFVACQVPPRLGANVMPGSSKKKTNKMAERLRFSWRSGICGCRLQRYIDRDPLKFRDSFLTPSDVWYSILIDTALIVLLVRMAGPVVDGCCVLETAREAAA